jgi:PAS domain S-box-containing protein
MPLTTSNSRKRSLARQLLVSHLSVASIGLGMLFIALVSTYGLRSRVILLASDSGPMAQASLKVLAGVRHSLSGLHGWVTLGDESALRGWQSAWEDEINPALTRLRSHPRMLAKFGESARFKQLQSLLGDLEESQWWVAEVARAPGNEPARITYVFDARPVAVALDSMIAALIHEEQGLGASQDRKVLLAELSEVQRVFSISHLLLREIVGQSKSDYERQFQDNLRSIQVMVEQIARKAYLLTPEQRHLLDLFRTNLQAFDAFAQEVIEHRQSVYWNRARHLMATETGPLAAQVVQLAGEMASRFEVLMKREADAAKAASAVTVWILVMLIVVMLVVAYAISRVRAHTLARPIAALSEATQQLATGRLVDDIPVKRDDELGELTRTFNAMRASLFQAQEELRDANASLEQRVALRTQELQRANADLTQEIAVRREAEQALRESEARLRAIGDAVPDLLFVLDEDGCYLEVLTSQQYLFNARVSSIRGNMLREIHSPAMAEFFLGVIRRALATQKIQVAEYELGGAAGTRCFESRTAPIELPSAAKRAVVVVARDITQRKIAEEQLRQAQKMEAIGQLTGGIAHDFNNLLAIVLGNLELLQEQLAEKPQLQDLVRRAFGAADRGATLTQRLLAFSRKQPLRARPIDLNELVTHLIDLLRRTLGDNIQVKEVLADPLWRPLIDAAQLENALLNLALNARDAMPVGGCLTIETANVQLEAEDVASDRDVQPGCYVMLAVSDTGTGMPPEMLERVVEPFFTTKEVGKGSGLGLSMVYGLVKQSGGHLTIDSEVGKGTTIKVFLPLALRAETEKSSHRLPREVAKVMTDNSERIKTPQYKAQEEFEQGRKEPAPELINADEPPRWESAEREVAAALRKSEIRLRAIADAVPDTLFMLDGDGRFMEVFNPQQCRIFSGLRFLKGELIANVFPAEIAGRLLGVVRETLLTRQTQIVEYEMQLPNIGRCWFEARIAPMEEAPGADCTTVVVVARDVTKRKLSEEKLRQAQKMEAIGQLTGGISHDFNNLLAIILGNLELLRENFKNQPELDDLVSRALDAADRGALLTQRLLAFSSRQPLRVQATNLNELVAGMIDLLRRTLGETVQIQTKFTDDLWPTVVDPGQFENALINLVVNARDAMPQGGTLAIETANVEFDPCDAAANPNLGPGQFVELAVRDNGAGMSPEVLRRACEPFYTTKKKGEGSGLGLSMVYGLVKQSGGHVEIVSEPKRGTTVHVYLPRGEAATGTVERGKADGVEELYQGQAQTLLVVEDDAQVRQLAVRMLHGLGYRTVEACDGEKALETLDEEPRIALLFTDVVLPGGMNGIELAKKARRLYPDLKVLFTSGYPEDALARHGPLEDDIELLAKPYHRADLANKLHAILG